MVRKVSAMFVCVLLIACLASTAHATSIPVTGSVSNTVTQYARDIVAKANFGDNYVLFTCEDEDTTLYVLYVGDLTYNENTQTFTINYAMEYVLYNSGYGTWHCQATDTGGLEVINSNYYMVYSNLGNYPELMSTGEKYEVLQTFTLCAVVLFGLCVRIFGKR